MIKIAFFDIDGTLLKMGCKEPTDKTVKALNSLHQNGILICMATGRGYLSIPKFKDITFDVLLTFNGSYVMAGEKIIFRNPLNNNDKHQIIQNLNKMNRAAAISNEHFIVTNGTDEHLEEYFKFGNETLTIADNFDELCKEDIYQIMCACRKEEYAQILQGTENTQITAWWDKAADIIPLNCGKGNAVNAVLNYYGLSKDEAIAFGDGRNDIEGNSQYITVSYVHFYDSGKCSLCGMKSESGSNYITYHHNWFDHSDSRHARVRTMSVHMYNNYYDGNAKYGAGSTMGSSLFIQNNYFRNCKNPMLSSNQGTDALGEGTFSGENGGIIKAYGNVIVGAQKIIYANAVSETGDSANAASFDAYLAKSADEKVPSSYKTLAGATSYDNFDTTKDLGVKSGSLNNAEDVPSVVTSAKGAGSLGGGVISWTFSDKDDSVYAIDKELKATVTNYKNTDLVSVGGTNAKIVSPDPTTEETKATESTTKTTQATTKETQTTTKATQATTKSTESATKTT